MGRDLEDLFGRRSLSEGCPHLVCQAHGGPLPRGLFAGSCGGGGRRCFTASASPNVLRPPSPPPLLLFVFIHLEAEGGGGARCWPALPPPHFPHLVTRLLFPPRSSGGPPGRGGRLWRPTEPPAPGPGDGIQAREESAFGNQQSERRGGDPRALPRCPGAGEGQRGTAPVRSQG